MMSDVRSMIVARAAPLMEAMVEDEMLALEPERGAFYRFNGTATRVWELIAQPRTLGELCDSLADEYDVAPADCEADTLELLSDLEKDGLVTLTSAT
jgi:hypothetical protein